MKRNLLVKAILLLMVFAVNALQAQQRSISGRVLDSKTNQTIPGVSVSIKGTTQGQITDSDGNFRLSVNQGDILVFSFVGYIPKEVTIGAETQLTVMLEEDVKNLGEVVVVGYGTQKKVNVTGAVATVNSDDIVKNSTANISSALSGRLAGLTTIQSSGEPGADAAALRIRGLSSLNNNSPLILIDGVPRSINDLNPNDIASISVLKDAAAAAIYGMRAANGVVLVTTKRGSAGEPKFNVNIYSGLQSATRVPDFLDSYNMAVLLNEANTNDGAPASFTENDLQKFRDGSNPNTHPNTDWVGETLKGSSFMQSADLSMRGTSENGNISYFSSLGYLYQDALYDNNDFNRTNFRTNLDIKITNNISLATDFSGSLQKTNRPDISSSTLISNLYRTRPTEVNQYTNGGYSVFAVEPRIQSGGFNENETFRFYSKVALNVDFPFLKGLSFTAQVAYDRTSTRGKGFNVPRTYTLFDENTGEFSLSTPSGRGETASLSDGFSQGLRVVTEGILRYNKTVDKHDFGGTLVYSRTTTESQSLNGGISNMLGTTVPFFIAGDAETRSLSNGRGESAILGYAGRFTYAYDQKYLFEVNGRYDGSYRFSKGARFDFFPSVSVAWRLSEEDFLSSSSLVSNAKLRLSYGVLGSDAIGAFRYLEFFTFGGAFIDNGTVAQTISTTGLADPSTTWEKAKTFNIAAEVGLWDDILRIEADLFYKRTEDILTTRSLQVPSTFGATLPAENIGVVDNRGIDISINHNNNIKGIEYYANFNMGYAKNEVIDIAEPEDVDPLRRRTGRPIQAGTRIGYIADGIFLTQQEIDDLNAAAGGVYQTQNPQPGDIKYRDLNGDGKVDGDDRTVIGRGNVPELTFGLNFGFQYEGFDFSALFQGAANFDMYLSNEASWAFFNGGKVFDKHLDRAQIGADGNVTNPGATYPRLTLTGNAVNERFSSYWLVPGDYLRFKNVEVGYTFKENVTAKLGLDKLRVYLNGRNLMTWSKIKHLDPENPQQRGWFYPQQRVFVIGLNAQF